MGDIAQAQLNEVTGAQLAVNGEEISRGVVSGRSMRTMAASLGRAPSTISREIGRNGGRQAYRASESDASAWQ